MIPFFLDLLTVFFIVAGVLLLWLKMREWRQHKVIITRDRHHDGFRDAGITGGPMKAFTAALVAIGVLYVLDSEYNDGRYVRVIKQAVTSMVSR
jgi:hypothetical protein